MTDLFDCRRTGFSQSGEEGVIHHIMELLGRDKGLCCEFGAWDGIHLSNTRQLMLDGWRGLMIEADPVRYEDLIATYPPGSSGAVCACALVDNGNNSLAKIAARSGITDRFDLVSIDIDGLDFEVFETLAEFDRPPLLVCVEVGNMHHPDKAKRLPREIAMKGPGQPLALFIEQGRRLGYRLVCYVGVNAFFLHADAGLEKELPTISARDAHRLMFPLIAEDQFFREWSYLCNLGMEAPYYRFDNPLFSRKALGISRTRALQLRMSRRLPRLRNALLGAASRAYRTIGARR